MNASSRDAIKRIDHAKDQLLAEEPPSDKQVVGEQVLASWRRSQFWGVSADHLDPPYSEEIDWEGQLAAAAGPVVDRLEAALSGTAMSIILTDAHGRILQRRTGEDSLGRQLDAISLAPGFSYAEEFVGTNGIGSAIESRRPFFVAGPEHFAHPLASVSCAGAPILQPLTGRLQGIIDLTCRATDATRLMKVLAEEAASEITQRLLEQGSVRERTLLHEFLAATHNSSRAVVAVIGDLVISNTMAAGTLDRGDYALVQDQAASLVKSGASVTEILLSNGDTAFLRARPAADGGSGVIVELTLTETRAHAALSHGGSALIAAPARSPGTAGRSGAWAVTSERVETSCRQRQRPLIAGEPGTGKLALLSAAHRRWNASTGLMRILDLAEIGGDVEAVTDGLFQQVQPGVATVVLRHLDTLSDPAAAVVAEWIEEQSEREGPWIAGTRRTGEAPATGRDDGTGAFAVVVTVPPLRHRIEDVRDLVPVLIERLAPGRDVRMGPEAMQTLLRHAWPGNVGELEEVLRAALTRRSRGVIAGEDLPEMAFSTGRQVLSAWEAMERDLITRALLEAKGDKVKAAARLGISRATIYRKLHAYGIVLTHHEKVG